MKRKSSIILMAFMMACSITACQGNSVSSSSGIIPSNKSAEVPEESSSAEPELSSEEQEEQERELYNLYIDVNNFMLGRLYDSLERYFNYVDAEQAEFTLLDEERGYFDCYSLSDYDIKKVESAYEAADSKSDKTALDKAHFN